jgi:hypothetical protein
MTIFADIVDHDEDTRIDIIGHQAIDHKLIVGFVVEADGQKADRYIRKLREKFPMIRVIDKRRGPVAGTELVRVGPPVN